MSAPVGYPLTRQQSALVERGGLDHTVRMVVRLPLTPAAARASLEAAVARHEVLRSTLRQEPALRTGLQLVHDVPSTWWTELAPGADADAASEDLAAHLDPVAGSVLAVGIGPDEADGSVVVVCGSVLFTDLRTLTALTAEAAGLAAPVEDPIQYTEYGAWQTEMLEDTGPEDGVAALVAWGRLADGEVRTVLPPAATGDPGSPTVLDAAPGAANTVAHWLALWALTVARLTGETTVSLGVELDPTDHPGLEGAAGPYACLIPLTLEVPERGKLNTFSDQVAHSLVQARTWFEWAPAGTGLAVLFSVGPVHSRVDREGFQVELRVAPDGRQAVVLPGADGSPAQAATVATGLKLLLSGGADTVEDLDVLDEETVQRLLGSGVTPVSGVPIVTRVREHAAVAPERTAITDGTTSISYADLVARVDALAAALLEASSGSRAPVAVHLPRSIDAVVAMLAAQRAGLGHVPLDVDGPPDRAMLQAAIAGATVLISDRSVPDGFAGAVVRPDAQAADAQAPAGLPEPAPGDLGYVMFTSGSTGIPKGVAVGQDNLTAYADAVVPVVEAAAGRAGSELVWALATGLTTDLGNTSVLGALTSGGTLHVVPNELLQDSAGLSAHLAAHPVDVMKITPTHLRALLADPDADVLPRSVLVLGGEALSWDLVALVGERGGCTVVNHYGPTETTVGALTHTVADRSATGTVPIGRALTGYEAVVVDRRLRLVPDGAVGELLITGAGVARGYLGDEVSTATAFIDHPYRPGVRAYRTGDLVSRDADGVITFLGRRDGQIKVRGYRVEPHEIEVALAGHPAVRRAAVVLRHDVGAAPALVGYVVTQLNPAPTEAELRDHLSGLLPEHMVPSRLVDLDTLPLRPNGKLDVQALPVPPQHVAAASGPPEGETEEALAAIFAEVLGAATVGATDDFFALGGHSLLATRVVVEIRTRLGVALPVYTLFDAPTVRQLASEVEAVGGRTSDDELSRLIAEISSLSDEEAALLLAEESSLRPDDSPS